MNKIELNVVALAKSESSPSNYSLVLEDVENTLRIPITIGPFEAQSIALHLERMQTNRPLTHDLFKNTIQALGAELKEVFIHKITDRAFHCLMTYDHPTKGKVEVDARTSDAIAMAIRFEVPIYIAEDILQDVGFPVNTDSEAFSKKRPLEDYSVNELEKLLEKILAKEDYKSAAKIRDLLKRKKEE